MQLMETLRPHLPLSQDFLARLSRIDTEDYSGVVRKVREEHPDHPASWYDEGVLALKQYYAVALLDGQNMHAVSDRVDPFWHAHILHTRQYTQFCDDVVGGYMHHDPLDHADSTQVRFVSQLYDFTQRRYRQIFTHVDSAFNPSELADEDLICIHFSLTYETAQHAIFPLAPEAQPRA